MKNSIVGDRVYPDLPERQSQDEEICSVSSPTGRLSRNRLFSSAPAPENGIIVQISLERTVHTDDGHDIGDKK